VDQRADLYSLAAVAYYALLGRPPFEGITPEVVLAKQTAGVLPPLQEERSDVSRELEELLRRAIASEPGRRFPTAQAFREALQQATGGFLRRLWSLIQGK
jgi:serine/threonine-protein kinase